MRRLVQFFALGFLLLMGLNLISSLTDQHDPVAEMDRALATVDGAEAVSLGGSIGQAVNFPDLCLNGADYFRDGQDLFEVTAFADLIMDRPNPPRYWFVVAAPSAQSYDNSASGSERGGLRRQVHRLLFRHGHFGMVGGDWRQLIVAAITPALGYDAWAERAYMLMARLGLMAPSPPRPARRVGMERSMNPATAVAEARAFTELQAGHMARVAYYDSSIARRSAEALSRMNRRIRERGGVMILVTPPMTEAVRASTLAGARNEIVEFTQMERRLAGEGVVISNHWNDADFGNAFGLYTDNLHLNGAGAKLFSQRLGVELRGRGIIPPGECPAIAIPPEIATETAASGFKSW